ncbi:MAG TPA: hypothetical protein DEF79_10510 [Gammaproteobacteria bacterium]|nr:hypothetical protein [Gammaproteobacteria bacterium]
MFHCLPNRARADVKEIGLDQFLLERLVTRHIGQHRDHHEAPSASLDNFILAKTLEASSANCPSPADLLKVAKQTLLNGAAHHHLQAKEAHQKKPRPSKAEALCWFLRPHERTKTSESL